jgi:hypothetical protein
VVDVVTVADVPLNFTMFDELMALKFVPVMITCSPAAALTGEKFVIVGNGGGGGGVDEPPFPHPIFTTNKNVMAWKNRWKNDGFIK